MTSAVAPAGIKVRAARRGDGEPVRALLAELGMNTDAGTFTWVVQHPEMKILVAVDSIDKAVGVVALSHRPQIQVAGRVVTIDVLVVSAAARKKGIGRLLLEAAVKEARVFAAKHIDLRAPTSDSGARVFLEHCGFKPIEELVFRHG